MATKEEIGAQTASAGTAKLPVVKLLVVVMFGAVLGVAAAGGGVYYLAKSGKLALGAASGSEAAGAPMSGGPHPMMLEPILVNLADEGGHAYLRLGLTLNVEDGAANPDAKSDARSEAKSEAKSGKTPSEQELAVRDTVLAVLGQQTSAWLLGPDGKEHLKIELKEALAKQNPQVKVTDVFFTDFLVQI